MSATGALTNGDSYLVLSMVNSRPEGTDGTNRAEVETRHGTTRLALNSFATTYAQFNTGDAALGNVAQCMAVVTGDGSSTINLRRQNTNGNASNGLHRVGGQETVAINLSDIGAENTAWWYSETANSETASVTPTGATWLRAGGTATSVTTAQSGEVQFSAPTTGDYLIIAYVESFFAAAAADGEEIIKRLRQVEDPSGSATTTTIGCGEVWARNNFESGTGGGPSEDQRQTDIVVDVRALTSGTTYRFQIEASSSTGATDGSCSRLRMFVLDLSALEDYAAITNGGDINASSGEDDGANDLTFNFSASSHDALVLASGNVNNDGGNWGDYVLREDPTGTPTDYPDTDGRMVAWGASSAAPDNTMPAMVAFSSIAGSRTIRAVGSADSGGTNYRWGRNPANTAAGRLVMVSLYMETPAAGTSGSASFTEGSDSIASAGDVDNTATSAFTEGADSTASAATVDNTATGAFTEGADSIAAAAVTANTATSSVAEGADSIVSAATLDNAATSAFSEGADSVASSATVGSGATTGSAAFTEGADAIVSAATVANVGTSAVAEGADSIVGAATLANTAAAAFTEGADTVVANDITGYVAIGTATATAATVSARARVATVEASVGHTTTRTRLIHG